MSERPCPRCGQGLRAARLGPVGIEPCLPCSGVWTEGGELARIAAAGAPVLRKLVERLETASPGAPTRPLGVLACPGCRVPLGNIEYPGVPGVRVDACPFCRGAWTSRELLERVAEALEPRPEPVDEMRDIGTPAPSPAPAGPVVSPWQAVPAAALYAAPAPPQAVPRVQPAVPAESARAAPTGGEQCPSCGQPNTEGAAVCWACGALLQGRVEGECPRCAGNLRSLSSDGVPLSACEGCGGAWLNEGRLSALLLQSEAQQEKLLAQIAKQKTGRMRTLNPGVVCRRCELIMFPHQVGMLSPQPVARCPGCCANFVEQEALAELLRSTRAGATV